jgi:predicted aspartyl protease
MKSGTLDMHTISGALFVYADIWNKNTLRFASGLLTFDTGATVTTISKDILFNLGYNVIDGDVRRIATASGVEYVREVNIEKMRLGKFVLPQVSVYAHTFPAEGFSTGVIGLNILSKFDISLLFSKKLIELVEI